MKKIAITQKYSNAIKNIELLKAEEVARVLRLHPSTVHRLIKKGQLLGSRIAGRYYITLEELENLIFSRR